MSRDRSKRAVKNDIAIRAAAAEMILKVGVDSLAFRDVAKAAKLTHGAIYARFEDVEELLVDLWSNSLAKRAISLFEVVSRAVARPTKNSVETVMDRVRRPLPEDIVMIKVLWTSRRHVIVHEEVESFIHDYLETGNPDMREPLRSRALCLFSFVMLALFASFQSRLEEHDLDNFENIIYEILASPPDEANTVAFDELIVRGVPLPTDDIKDKLTYHTYLAVGKSGYSRATISRISRRADCSPGAIYKIFPSKEELVIGSVNVNMTAPWIRIAALATILDPGKLAQILYSAASTENNVRKHFVLEVTMASAYNEKLRSAVSRRMSDIESVVPLIGELSDFEVAQLKSMIRFVTFTTMGVSYLSTVTKATDHVDFSQFAEPARESILKTLVPSWPAIRRQLENISCSVHEDAPALNEIATLHHETSTT